MIESFTRIYFNETERREIIKRFNIDQRYLKLTKEYDDQIEVLREKIRKLEEERSERRTKLFRKIQYEFYKEKKSGS